MSLCLRHATRLLRHQGYYKQGYCIKVYQGYYVTMTLTNHRTFQNWPTLDAKKMHFCSSESRESRIFGISAMKTIVLKNKMKLFFDLQLVNCVNLFDVPACHSWSHYCGTGDRECNFVAYTKPSGGTGSLRLLMAMDRSSVGNAIVGYTG